MICKIMNAKLVHQFIPHHVSLVPGMELVLPAKMDTS